MVATITRAVTATQNFTRGVLGRLAAKRPKTIVAVEWGGEWLKMAQVAVHPRGKQLVRLEAREIPSPGELPKILHALFTNGVDHADSLIVSLPRNLVTVRNLKLPSTDPVELKEMISLQAARQTPYSKEEIISNFQRVGTAAEGYTDVILAIANREVSHERLKVLEEAHLKTAGIRLTSQGILNWQRMAQPSKADGEGGTIAVVDIDATFTDFVVVSDGQLIFTKAMSIGASKLLEGEGKWVERFTQEMKAALDLYEHQGVGNAITRVVLTGAEMVPVGLKEAIQQKWGLVVERVSILEKVPGVPQLAGSSEMQRRSTSFTAVVGLAWDPEGAGIDLIPFEVVLKEGLAARGRDLMIMGVLLLSILMVISGMISERLYFKRQYLEQLRQEVQRTTEQATELERLRREIRIVRESSKVRNSPMDVLSLLHQLMPPEIYLTAITFKDGEELTLTGVSQEMSDVFKFVSVLDQQAGFGQVKVKHVTQKVREGEKGQSDFEVVCLLKAKSEDQIISF